MCRPASRQVKVLDFGLAKALGPPEGGPYVPHGGPSQQGVGAGFSRLELTRSPTLSVQHFDEELKRLVPR
jgi:hypothetical protein